MPEEATMIDVFESRFRQLLLDKSAKEGRRITIKEVSEVTGLSRNTLNLIAQPNPDSFNAETFATLMRYFGLKRLDDLMGWKEEATNGQEPQ
jgi:hypothetical protein